jgi:hypothetical protein
VIEPYQGSGLWQELAIFVEVRHCGTRPREVLQRWRSAHGRCRRILGGLLLSLGLIGSMAARAADTDLKLSATQAQNLGVRTTHPISSRQIVCQADLITIVL